MLPEILALDIDPVSAATESYKVGGLQLVCLLILVIVVVLVFRFLFKRLEKLDSRVAQVEDSRAKLMEGVIKDNTAACHASCQGSTAVVKASEHQTTVINQLLTAMGERPCFNSQTAPAIRDPEIRRHRTPFPKQYPPT